VHSRKIVVALLKYRNEQRTARFMDQPNYYTFAMLGQRTSKSDVFGPLHHQHSTGKK
jgi:hypothetical protein